jgi:UDP-N-acetylmuramyl tripeptide synthase
MARVAEELADSIIVTSDNPRTENPNAIISEIVTGFRDPNATNIAIEPDRRKAIGMAIETARKGDIILIAGKGHETYQVLIDGPIPFDDREVARGILREMGYTRKAP